MVQGEFGYRIIKKHLAYRVIMLEILNGNKKNTRRFYQCFQLCMNIVS
ncbi:hypothetical protein MtrunA17_Chr2g0323251 [Medicago truncatula]|uniref:Uncharacterized protein n=1 Tax=Medicago truncatula TaxID=3880 RepID=A0A396JFZ5_MEDTR|nr:hypothetical protein MtrunA17_Chr2g0323251 [Medicago truncatula]